MNYAGDPVGDFLSSEGEAQILRTRFCNKPREKLKQLKSPIGTSKITHLTWYHYFISISIHQDVVHPSEKSLCLSCSCLYHVSRWRLLACSFPNHEKRLGSRMKTLRWLFKASLPETECTSPETNKWNPKMELWFRGYSELSFSFRSYDIRFHLQFQECIDIRFHVQSWVYNFRHSWFLGCIRGCMYRKALTKNPDPLLPKHHRMTPLKPVSNRWELPLTSQSTSPIRVIIGFDRVLSTTKPHVRHGKIPWVLKALNCPRHTSEMQPPMAWRNTDNMDMLDPTILDDNEMVPFFFLKGWTRSKSLSKLLYKSFGEFLYPLKHLQVFEQNKFQKDLWAFPKKTDMFPQETFRQDLFVHAFSQRKTPASTDKPCPSMASRNRTARKRERVWSNLRWWILTFQHVRYALFTDGLKGMKWEYGYMMIYEYALYADIWKIVIWRNLRIFSAAYNTGHSPSKNNLRCSVGKGHAYLLFQLCYISSLGSGLKPILLQDGSNGLLLADRFFSVQTVSKCLRRFADVFANPTLLYILEQPINNIISPSEHRFQKKRNRQQSLASQLLLPIFLCLR